MSCRSATTAASTVPYEALPLAENVDESTAVFLKERREDYPGVEVEEGFLRKYRYAPIASQIVGYMGAISKQTQDQFTRKGYQLNDRVGVAGVEQTYEDELRGKPGYIKYAVDARNRVLGVVEQVEPVPGQRRAADDRPQAAAVRRADRCRRASSRRAPTR